MRIYENINPDHADSYFKVAREGNSKEIYLHKQTACWLLTDKKNISSSGRRIRVQQTKWISYVQNIFTTAFEVNFLFVWCPIKSFVENTEENVRRTSKSCFLILRESYCLNIFSSPKWFIAWRWYAISALRNFAQFVRSAVGSLEVRRFPLVWMYLHYTHIETHTLKHTTRP